MSIFNKNIYIVHCEVGNMPKEQIVAFAKSLKVALTNEGIKHAIIIPTNDGIPEIRIEPVDSHKDK